MNHAALIGKTRWATHAHAADGGENAIPSRREKTLRVKRGKIHSRAWKRLSGLFTSQQGEFAIDTGAKESARAHHGKCACLGIPARSTEATQTLASLARHAADIHRFVALRVANASDAADIAQQTFLQAAQSAHRFRGGNGRAWLFTIARNLVVDHYRGNLRYEFVDVSQAAAADTRLCTHWQVVLDKCERHQQLAIWLKDVSRTLEPEEQVAVLAADAYEYSARDSAVMLQITVPSFKLLLHGARVLLRESIARGGDVQRRQPVPIRCPLSPSELEELLSRLLGGLAQAVT